MRLNCGRRWTGRSTSSNGSRARDAGCTGWFPAAGVPSGRARACSDPALARAALLIVWILRTLGDDEQTFRLLPNSVKTIGRATGADFIVNESLVSRVHCRVEALAGGELEVRDLDSTNGTFVNGARVTTARLATGDRLRVGRVELIALRGAD
ncbi:MAG: FHA domain-containing protein [Acidimicrobiia bacterium]|nr:FHA domain-containing protein [Acidimicrobiia bacterium]